MPVAALYLDDGSVESLPDDGAIAERLARRAGMLWVHVTEATEDDVGLLGELFGFHPLALHDCLNPADQRPKVDDFGDYLFLLLHGIDHEATGELVVTTELDLFVGPSFVVTASLTRLAAIDDVFARAAGDAHVMQRGPGLLPYTLIDALVDAISPTMDRMGEVAELIEEEALSAPHRDLLPAILRLKRSALHVHRVMRPQRELLARMARGDYALLPREYSFYYRDVYDHIDRIDDMAEALRERSEFATTTYLSAVTIRQNEATRVLTIVAAVFLPLTLAAGIYGMNFENMPELGWRYGYFAVLSGMLVFAAAVTWWLWGRDWVAASRRRIAHELHFGVEQPLLREALQEAARLRRLVLPSRGTERGDPRT